MHLLAYGFQGWNSSSSTLVKVVNCCPDFWNWIKHIPTRQLGLASSDGRAFAHKEGSFHFSKIFSSASIRKKCLKQSLQKMQESITKPTEGNSCFQITSHLSKSERSNVARINRSFCVIEQKYSTYATLQPTNTATYKKQYQLGDLANGGVLAMTVR